VAIEHRDDLQAVRALVSAAEADTKAARWNAFGPTALLGAQFGGIAGSAEDVAGIGDTRFALHDQWRIDAGGAARLSAASFGDVATSDAIARIAGVEAARALELVRAQLVTADRDRRVQRSLAPLARAEFTAAEEALRLAHRRFEVGMLTTFDVLQRESALTRARTSFAEAVLRYNQAQLDLVAALGVLDTTSLGVADGA